MGSSYTASALIVRRISSFRKPLTYSFAKELKAAFFFATATTAEWMRSSTGETTRMWFGKRSISDVAVKIAHGNGHGGTVHDLRCAHNRVQQRRGGGSRLLPRRPWIQVRGCRPRMAHFCLAAGGGRVSSR